MHERLQDALTLTSTFYKPDLFITMTGNSKWSEIQDQLPTGFSPQSHPDNVNCVLHQKKKKLIKLIEKDRVFARLNYKKEDFHIAIFWSFLNGHQERQ